MGFWKVVLTAAGVFTVLSVIGELIMWPIRKSRLKEFITAVNDGGKHWDNVLEEKIRNFKKETTT